jgi:dimeric dUTPase (all-alpha-NTP-PPase superfamily)
VNLAKLFELQRQLDEHIEKEHPRQPGEDRLAKKILALQVELGELANCWRGFKYWSRNQEPHTLAYDECPCGTDYGSCDEYGCDDGLLSYNPLLEEYADGLHFVLSIGLELNEHNFDWFREYEANKMPGWYLSDTITEQFNAVFFFVSHLLHNIDDYSRNLYGDVICYYLGLGEMLGFSWKEIEEAYMKKNAVNHQRQESGY